MDLVFAGAAIPAPGETVLGRTWRQVPGGKGANQAVAACRLGAETAFVGCLGADAFGDELYAEIESAGADVTWLRRAPSAPTGVAGILLDDAGENSIMVIPGANGELRGEVVKEAILAFQPTVVLTQLEIPEEAVEACATAPILILNPAPARPVSPSVLSRVSVLTPNASEATSLTGIQVIDEPSCRAACAVLHETGVKTVILTLGSRGCFVSANGISERVASPAVATVDTTAAGDAFNGALAVFLSQGLPILEAANQANSYAALSTTAYGAQSAMPTLAAWQAFCHLNHRL